MFSTDQDMPQTDLECTLFNPNSILTSSRISLKARARILKKLIAEVQSLMDQYATVKPSCGNGCPEHLTSRKRVVVTSKSERSNKRKSIKREVSRRVRKRLRKGGTPDYHGPHLHGLTNVAEWLVDMKSYWKKL